MCSSGMTILIFMKIYEAILNIWATILHMHIIFKHVHACVCGTSMNKMNFKENNFGNFSRLLA